jgi:ketosteroid isomerase-like protein
MTPEENKALVRRFYEEIDKGNLDAMDELVAEDYLDHNPPPFPGLAPGRKGLTGSSPRNGRRKMSWDS